MKKLVASVFFFVSLFSAANAADARLYGQKIYVDNIPGKEVEEALGDLKQYLEEISGKPFSVQQPDGYDAEGIYLLWNNMNPVNTELQRKLEQGSIEDFVLSGSSRHLFIIATHVKGFSRAVYTYLDYLGVKWYFPGAEWQIVPRHQSITYTQTKYISPSFRQRDFFGTGAIREMPFDLSGSLKKQWQDWKRRNRMGGDIEPGGHYGEIFNYKHQAELERHPEYLALVKNKRQSWSAAVKWCVSNPAFRNLFVADRVEELKQQLAQKPPNENITLSVDPADGGGDCECDACKKIGSVSNRYFLLANEVAKTFAKMSKRAYVNIYAYNTHSTPPSFALASNLIVQVVPYAFQDVGTPEQLIQLWKQRHSNVLMYDYYAVPDWFYDEPDPRKTSPDTLLNRIKMWKSAGIRGLMLESTFSIGNAGLGLYFMSRLGWDVTTNVEQEKQAFYKSIFGDKSAQARQLFETIGNAYQGSISLPNMIHLVDPEEWKVAGTMLQRITDLQAYVHYLVLYQKWKMAGPSEKEKAQEELLSYVLGIYPLRMIHSTRLAELLVNLFSSGSRTAKNWSLQEPYGTDIKQLSFASSQKISKLISKDAVENPSVTDMQATESAGRNYRLKLPSAGRIGETPELMFLTFPETYIKAGADGNFHFSAKYRDEIDNMDRTTVLNVVCTDTATKQERFRMIIELTHQWKEIVIPLSKGKTYQLTLVGKGWIQLRTTVDQWMGFKSIPTYFVTEKLWFYTPSSTKYIYYTKTEGGHPIFLNEKGIDTKPKPIGKLNSFQLDAGNEGWWQIRGSGYKFLQFSSIPDMFFLHPFYIVSTK